MIGRQRSPEQTMNKNGIQSNGLGYTSTEVRTRGWYLNSTAKLKCVPKKSRLGQIAKQA